MDALQWLPGAAPGADGWVKNPISPGSARIRVRHGFTSAVMKPMSVRQILFSTLAVMLLLASSSSMLAARTPMKPKVVRQVDHVLIHSAQAKELFALLSETFQLPVAWPMSDYGGFASGGVFVGNVNLEVIRSPDAAPRMTNRFTGFALEPEPLQTSLPELDVREISHGSAVPFRTTAFFGPSQIRWTTVALPTVSAENVEIFLCEYDRDLPARRRRLREELDSRKGGPLSVNSVREIVYGARDETRTTTQWQKLLAPLAPVSPGFWKIGAGPAIRVRASERDEIQEIIIAVRSLPAARQFLNAHHLLVADETNSITLRGPLLDGLRFTLVEASSVPE